MTNASSPHSLQDVIDATPDLFGYFYNDTIYPHFRNRTSAIAQFIPPAFTNWRDEQRAWRETAVLFDQSHHMPELFLSGPDALALLERTAINTMSGFSPDRARQFVACTPRGHVIGDCIAYNLGRGQFELVSGMTVLNWVHYHAETGDFDVKVSRDEITSLNPSGRRVRYRYQLDGPAAEAIFEEVVEGESPDIPFFRVARVSIAAREVVVLRHGMAGHKGYELSGPYEDGPVVREALMQAGARHGLVAGGTAAYFSTPLESGWIPYPPAGIFTGEELRGFREWLPADGWEASTMYGGSYCPDDIEDLYVTPWDLGYGHLLKFDHDFIGRTALEAMATGPHGGKVTLLWNCDDVERVYASQFGRGPRYKQMEFPMMAIGWPHVDVVTDADGRFVGRSMYCGYSGNERIVLSLATLDADHLAPGTEVTVTWGEPGGGSRKPHVESHEQTQVRATVAPAPLATATREMKTLAV